MYTLQMAQTQDKNPKVCLYICIVLHVLNVGYNSHC